MKLKPRNPTTEAPSKRLWVVRLHKLLAGTKIAFKGKSKAGKEMMVAGGLAQQTYQGRKFWGFKPEFDEKKGGFGG